MKKFTQLFTNFLPILFAFCVLFGVNVKAWGTCTYDTNYGGTSATANGKWNSYKGFGDITICSPNSDLKIVSVSMTVSIDGSGWDKGFKGTLKTNDGTNLKSNFEVDCGSSAICSANVNKSGVTRIYFSTSNTYSKSRTVTISNIVVTYEYAGSLSLSSSSHGLGNVNIDGNASEDFTVSSYNLSGTPTVTPSGDTNGFSTKLTANTGDCPKTWKLNVKYAPTCSNTTTYTQKKCTVQVSLGGKSQSMIVSATPTLVSQAVSWKTGINTTVVTGETLDISDFAESSSTISDKSAIYYTSSDESIISVDADKHTLRASTDPSKIGSKVTITAHQAADCKFAESTATKDFSIVNKLTPNFVLWVDGVAQEGATANLKVGESVEIHCENAPSMQIAGGSENTFTYSKAGNIVTVTATGECTDGILTLSQGSTNTIAEGSRVFTFNITKNVTELSSLLNVDNFYVGNSVYAATAYDFVKGTAYSTNNTDVEVSFSSTNENAIKLVDGQIKALAAGTATIRIEQEATNKWTGVFVEQTITVKKRPAVFTWNVGSAYTWNQSISNPFSSNNHDTEINCVSKNKNVADYVDGKVVIYNVSGTANFTLAQAGNDVWEETSQQYTVTVSKVSNHVEFTYTQAMYNDNSITVTKASKFGTAWDNGKLRLGGSSTSVNPLEAGSLPAFNYDDKYVDIMFSGIPSQLSFQIATNANAATQEYWYVKESSNGSNWSGEKWQSEHEGESFSSTQTVDLSPDTRYVRLCYSGNFAGYFKNIKVTERREVKPHESADVDCGTANHGENATEGKAILEWYNVKPLTCSITSEHPEAFELVTTKVNSELDAFKVNEEIVVRGKHDVPAGTYTGTLHVTNGTESTTFNLTTTTTKQTPSIKWKNELSPMSVGDVVADAASAGSATVHYTVDGTYLTLNEQGAVVAENATDENGVDLIAYVAEDETWKAASETIKVVVTNLQKQTITWTDKLSFKFTGTKVIDLTATSSSGVEITYELSGTGNYATLDNANKKLTVTNIGSTLYLTAKTVDNAEYYPAARTKTINSRDPNASCASEKLYEEYAEQTLTTGVTSFLGEWVELDWSGEHPGAEPGVISFKIKRGTAAAGDMALDEWYDNEWHRVETYSVSTTYATKTETLSRKATKVRIGAPTGATLKHYVKDIVLYQAKYCELSKTALDFGTVTMGTASTMSFTVHYSNLEKSLDIELENENTQFSVDKTYIGDDCGEHGTVTVTVTYNAANYVESESTNLIISNTEYKKTVSLKALIKKASQTITWNPASLDLKTTDDMTFDAVTTDAAAATGIVVTYAVKGESDVATVTSDGHLTILKDGSVTIVASAEGNSQYEDATPVEKTFTISKVTPTITNNPTISAITLPATLSNVAIDADDATAEDDKHNAVTGSFAWQTGLTKVLSGANDYAIVFTPNQPTGKDWYNEVVYIISVTGIKDSQEITWTRADETTQPCSTPTTFDASSNRGLTISYSSSDESVARVEKVGEEYRLVVLTSGMVDITASQNGNGDYEAATPKTKRITLTKEQPVIVTPPTAEAIFTDNHLYDAGLSGGEGQVNGVHAEGIFSWKNGDIQPEAGTHTYTAIFTPSPAEWYYPAECQVSVTVSKHPHTISWGYAGGTINVDKDDLYFSGATSSAELTNIYYTTSNDEVAEVDKTDGNKLIIHGKGTIDIIARSEGNTNYYAAEQRRSLTILPLATTVLAAPTATDITYGDALSESDLTGGTVKGSDDAVIAGKWTWNDSTEVLNAGNGQSRGVTFTPTLSNWYATVSTNATVNVNKATPTETVNNVEITYGTKAEDVALVGTGAGNWSWNDDRANQTLDADVYNDVAVRFTPNDKDNYNVQDATITLTINQATPDFDWTVAPTSCNENAEGVVFTAASEASNGAITYTIKEGTCAAISETSGALTIHEAGMVTIQATLAATTNYTTRTITAVLTINAPNVFTNASGDGDWNNPDNWTTGVPAETEPDVVIRGELEINNENDTVGNLTIENTGSITLISGGTLTVTGESEYRSEYGDIHVMDNGALALGEDANLQVRHFILDVSMGDNTDAHPTTSGQVSNEEKLKINGDAYFQISFDPRGAIDYGWYDFTVPFEVDVLKGIFDKDGNKLTNNVDYAVMEFSEAKRAANVKAWTWFSGTLQPGKLYSITLEETKTWNTFLFKRKAKDSQYGSNTFGASYTDNGATTDCGWNGMGNGTLQHCQLNNLPENAKIQVYDHTNDRYVEREANGYTYAVGTAFFVQVDKAKDIDLTSVSETRGFLAPARNGRTCDEFRLSMMDEEATMVADQLWVSASEEATGEYIIGHDLVKMGTPTSAKVAQMWCDNNGLKLCDIEMPLINDNANCALGLFAPKTGSYWLAIDKAPEDATLYLTYNDAVIWDLTISPYLFDLSKGTTTGYGLRIEVKKTPAIMTGVEQSEFSDQSSVRKVIIDNKVYVVTPEGKMYDIVGKGIKF